MQSCSEAVLSVMPRSDSASGNVIVIDRLHTRWTPVWLLPLCSEGLNILRLDVP